VCLCGRAALLQLKLLTYAEALRQIVAQVLAVCDTMSMCGMRYAGMLASSEPLATER
jgi:hypothetical protein